MSQIHLYLDQDAQRQGLVQALRNVGVDVVTTLEANNSARVDEEQLIWAIEQERVIYSFNVRDFCRLHTTYMEQGMEHTGIILAERQSYSIGDQLRGLLRLMKSLSSEEIRNQLVFLGTYIRTE